MIKKTEICLYCGSDYVPKRRGVQKFCSNSCRSLNWKNNQQIKGLKATDLESNSEKSIIPKKQTLHEKMSLAGIGNAAVGTAAVEIAKKILTPNNDRPATKKDIQDLMIFLKSRYLLVNNLKRDIYGRPAYYDIVTGNITHK